MQSFDRMVLEWARKQPAGRTYSYTDSFNCALATFLKETGICKAPLVGGDDWDDEAGASHPLSLVLQDALEKGEPTFGALADRLSTALLEKVG